MSEKGSAGTFFRRSFVFFLPALFFLLCAIPFLFRDLWFDEALTVLNFALLPSMEKIYFSYVIPNNQILHTIFLREWICLFGFSWLRIFPLLTALGVIASFALFRSRLGKRPLLIAVTALVISPPFLLYGTAIRGYMLSSLFVLLACRAACDAVQFTRKRSWAAYFFFSLLALGTMPGALAALAGAACYALPLGGKKTFPKHFLLLIFLLAAAFLLFYLPIFRNLLCCAALKEGWQNGNEVILIAGTTLAALFFLPLFPALSGIFPFRKKRFLWRGMIFLLIPAAAWILHPAPFPRVFFPLFPLFALLLAGGIRRFFARLRKKRSGNTLCKAFFLLLCGTLLWGFVIRTDLFRLGQSHCISGQDDFWYPYFLRSDFRPSEIAELLRREFPGRSFPLYLSFASDPWAIMYAFASRPGAMPRILFDGPQGKVKELPPESIVILHRDENPAEVEKRFSCRLHEAGKTEHLMHRIYRTGGNPWKTR